MGSRLNIYFDDASLFILKKKGQDNLKFNKSNYIQKLIKRDNQDKLVSLVYEFDLKIKEAEQIYSQILNQFRINDDLKIKVDKEINTKINKVLEENKVKMEEMKIQAEQKKKLEELYKKEAEKLWKEFLEFVEGTDVNEFYQKFKEFKSQKPNIKEEVWDEVNLCWRGYWEKQKQDEDKQKHKNEQKTQVQD